MNREKELIKNIIVLFIGNVVPKIANFIVLPILTGYLTKVEYGTYDLVTVICSLILPMVTVQIQTSAFRFLIDYRNNRYGKNKIISNIFIFLIPINFFIILIMFLILNRYSVIIRLLICGYFLSDIFYSICGQITRGLLKSKIFATASVICSISNLIFVFLLIYLLKMKLTGVLLCLLLSHFLPTIYMVLKLQIFQYLNFKYFDKKLLIEMLLYSWPMVPNALSMWVMNISDRFIISLFLGIEANAIYAVSKKIPNILTNVQSTFIMAWQESATLASDDSDSNKYYSQMFDIIFSVMAAAMMGITTSMPLLFKILIKGDYNEAYFQMPILILGMFFFSLSAYYGGIYTAKKATKSVGITTLIAAIINLLINLFTIKYIGLYAASISTLISYTFLFLFRMYDLNKKYIKIEYNYNKIILVIISLMIVLFLSYFRTVKFYILEVVIASVVSIIINKKMIYILYIKVKKLIYKKASITIKENNNKS